MTSLAMLLRDVNGPADTRAMLAPLVKRFIEDAPRLPFWPRELLASLDASGKTQ